MTLRTTFSLLFTFVPALVYSSPLNTIDVKSLAVNASNKAGLAWPNSKWEDMKQYENTGKVGWYYTWSPWIVETSDLEFVPMLWGPSQLKDWQDNINSTLASGKVTAVLGMNEPQELGQSNMTAEDGAAFWKTNIEPLKAANSTLRLGSPATSSAPSGKKWIQDWLTACQGGCSVDFIALHWYDVNATDFIRYITDFHDTFNKTIWVTEWACQNYNDRNAQCTEQHVIDFMNRTQTFMDQTDWVERYAWFGAMKNLQGVNGYNALMDPNGKITTLGKQYTGEEQPTIVDQIVTDLTSLPPSSTASSPTVSVPFDSSPSTAGNGPLAPGRPSGASTRFAQPWLLLAMVALFHVLA